MGRRVVLVSAAALFLSVSVAGAAVINGTKRGELLRGGPRADRIDAKAGNDRIKVDGGGRDTVRCGRGVDLVNADAADRLARDCETVVRVIARDRYTTPAQHSTIAEPDSFAWGNTVVAAFQSGRFRDGGAVNTGWATSRDGGRTWRSGVLPSLTPASVPAGPWDRASDPVVAYDSVHGTWLIASLALRPGNAAAVVVSRSPDGLTWSAPVTVVEAPWQPNLLLDKEWIVCDNGAASPHRGSCYVTYSDFRTFRLEFQASRDGGLTWSGQVAAPDNAGRASIIGQWAPAPQPVVQPDGDVIVPYYDENRVAAIRSADGGRSFSASVTVAPTAVPADAWAARPAASERRGRRRRNHLRRLAGLRPTLWPEHDRRLELDRRNHLVDAHPARAGSSGSRLRPPRARSRSGATRAPRARLLRVHRGRLPRRRVRDVGGRRPAVDEPRRLNAQTMRYTWAAQAGGVMVGDYFSASFVGRTVVPVFVLASPPGSRLDQALFAARFAVR